MGLPSILSVSRCRMIDRFVLSRYDDSTIKQAGQRHRTLSARFKNENELS